ncbi:hypothetical protein DICVIV_14348 [Dictyocaulus viviparus]|uniref:Uncharacterized protein n=1 Tax=Dictyocaulus viviparus TaxID=29172 RepID=A0A0D8X7Z2_DICVI|nr:hypothetical protein DICVIV_14348 [Dictyocaulus viviparus]
MPEGELGTQIKEALDKDEGSVLKSEQHNYMNAFFFLNSEDILRWMIHKLPSCDVLRDFALKKHILIHFEIRYGKSELVKQ